ncbi:Wadjet anti-phage system protein JetD domain-containing protein [Butyrivibrio sp. XBB1001]|uniref:Wadjet anti-phage system protein JetD domain-containing protein n=1 Tax=Butyrivibrio sp. XBB1001 TaxID=1280682 RepID=UPI0003FC2A68|nr:Wadjet anti-phage system protein JetD domain-containing protein [Butyrivibrio sp. XBB1001]
MTDKSIKLNKRQKEVLKALLDKFEKSKTYRGENTVNQSFKVKPSDFFRDYDSDFANLDEQGDFERELCGLEDAGLIYLSKSNGVIKSIDMVITAQDSFYSILGRTELKQLEDSQISMYKSHLGENEVLDLFCKTQIKRLEERKKAEYEMPVASEIIRILEYIGGNTEEILERELSIELFGDSKRFERDYRNKVLTVLKKNGNFRDLIEDVPDDREQGHAILAEYNIFPNPTYVNFKGDGILCLKGGKKIELSHSLAIAIDSGTLGEIDTVIVNSSRIVTVENLTSFNRVQDEDTFFVYLAGYHNTAKQNFIRRIAESNLDKEWFHFGDIDPDGFYILEHLKKKTGIAFLQLCMGVDELKSYKEYCKPLESNDEKKAKSLIEKGLYEEVMRYMLKNNIKLEQEVISWKQKV